MQGEASPVPAGAAELLVLEARVEEIRVEEVIKEVVASEVVVMGMTSRVVAGTVEEVGVCTRDVATGEDDVTGADESTAEEVNGVDEAAAVVEAETAGAPAEAVGLPSQVCWTSCSLGSGRSTYLPGFG